MALTSTDETDLLLPLYGGAVDRAPFAVFLQRLARRTGTVGAALLYRPSDQLAGPDRDFAIGRTLPPALTQDSGGLEGLRPGRSYALDELSGWAEPCAGAGIADLRIVRLAGTRWGSSWLAVAGERPCTAADSALLSGLAPYAAQALTAHADARTRAATEALHAAGLDRSASGWIAFDAEARVVASGGTGPLAPRPGQRLPGIAPQVEARLAQVAQRFSIDPGPAEAIVLTQSPRIEAVLLPPPAGMLPGVAMIAQLRRPAQAAPDRAALLAALFALPPREAELAVALADGRSIKEAAHALSLTEETARNYSKKLYARLGVRGQAELVALVLRSGANLSLPDAA